MGFLGGLFDNQERNSMAESALNMRDKMQNVQKMGAKILDRSIFSNHYNQYARFYFRTDVILAHTNNIQLVNCKNFDGYQFLPSNFKKIVRLNDNQLMPQIMDEIITDPLETVKPTDVHQKLNPLLDKSDEHLSVTKKS